MRHFIHQFAGLRPPLFVSTVDIPPCLLAMLGLECLSRLLLSQERGAAKAKEKGSESGEDIFGHEHPGRGCGKYRYPPKALYESPKRIDCQAMYFVSNCGL